jgi:hypothetical protein
MKKTILVFLVLFLCFRIFGQIEKGARLVGTSFNYSQDKNTQNTSNTSSINKSINIEIRYGIFVTKRIAVGVLGGYGNSNSSSTSMLISYLNNPLLTSTSITNLYSAGIFSRGYKMFMNNKIGFFCQLDAVYLFGTSSDVQKITYQNTTTQSSGTTGNINGFTAGLHPGVTYFITDKIGLEVSFGNFYFNTQTQKNYDHGNKIGENKTSGLNLDFGLNTFYVGVNFYFGGRKKSLQPVKAR